MMIFQKFPTFYIKIRISIGNAKCFARFARLFALFGPARPGCARPYKTNAIPSLFRGFWCPGAHFRKKHFFTELSQKLKIVVFSQISTFWIKIMISVKSTGLQKHQYSLSFINGFGGSMARKMQNPLNLLKYLNFSEIPRNSIILCKFQCFQ